MTLSSQAVQMSTLVEGILALLKILGFACVKKLSELMIEDLEVIDNEKKRKAEDVTPKRGTER